MALTPLATPLNQWAPLPSQTHSADHPVFRWRLPRIRLLHRYPLMTDGHVAGETSVGVYVTCSYATVAKPTWLPPTVSLTCRGLNSSNAVGVGSVWDTGLCCGTIARSISGSTVDRRMFHGTLHSPKDPCPGVTGYPLSTECTSAIQVSLRAGMEGSGLYNPLLYKHPPSHISRSTYVGAPGTSTLNSPALSMSRVPPTLVGNHLPGVVPEWPVVTASTAAL